MVHFQDVLTVKWQLGCRGVEQETLSLKRSNNLGEG
jgi:hypothetical protein